MKWRKMKGTTHASFAVVSNVIVSNMHHVQLEPKTFAVLALASTFGGLLPDIDHGNSKLGNKIPIVDAIISYDNITIMSNNKTIANHKRLHG